MEVLDLNEISQYQSLSKDFIFNHYDKLNPKKLLDNQRIQKNARQEIMMIEKLSGSF
jgi:hypothetical protein